MKKRLKGLAALWLTVILALHVMPAAVIADVSQQTATPSKAAKAAESEENSGNTGQVWVYKGKSEITSTGDLHVVQENVGETAVAFGTSLKEQIDLTNVLPDNSMLTGWKLWVADSGYTMAEEKTETLQPDDVISADEYSEYCKYSNNVVLLIPVWKANETESTSSEPSSEETKPSSEETKPSSEETQPSSEETQPPSESSSEETQPSSEETQPPSESSSGTETQPSSEETQPSPEETKPSPEETQPSSEETKPSQPSTEEPTSEETPVSPKPEETQISDGGTYTLKKGDGCGLGEGNWTVDGDPTVYRGGRRFYAGEDGNYTFHKK